MAKKEINIVLRAKNAMQAELSKAGESLKKFGQSALRIGKAFATAFLAAGTAVAGFAVKALQAWSVQEAAERSAMGALRAHGDEIENNMQLIRRHASEIQNETGVADENIIARMARLRMLGVEADQLGEAARATVALASAGMGEEQAIRAVAMAREGNFTALNRYIPALRNATSEAEKAAIVNDFLTKGYAQQKEQLNTVSGQWNLLKNRVGDVWEELGRAIAQNGALIEVLKRASQAVADFGNRIREWVDGGGIARSIEIVKLALEDMRAKIQQVIDLRVEIATAAITAAMVALSIKLIALSKQFTILTTNMTASTVAAAAKAAALKLTGKAAAGATIKVAALKMGLIALKAVPVLAIAAAFVAITKAVMETNEATRQLRRSMKDLSDQGDAMFEEWGTRSASTLRTVRQIMQGGDQDAIANLERTMPKAVARWRELHETVEDVAEEVAEVNKETFTLAKTTEEYGETAVDAFEAAANAAKRLNDAEDELRKEKEKGLERIANLEERLADEKRQREEKALRDEIDNEKKKLADKQRIAALGVQGVIAEAKKEANIREQQAKDAEKAAALRQIADRRGATLSRREQEWLDAFDKVQAAGVGADAAENRIAELERELKEQQEGLAAKKLDELKTELEKNTDIQEKLAKDLAELLVAK